MKESYLTSIGIIGSILSFAFGGWDTSLLVLLSMMCIDYVSGIIVAGVFHKSQKTESGTLESRVGWKGLCKKGMTLVLVVVGNLLDMQMGLTVIRDGVCCAFIANECISIIENAGLMGIPIPSIIVKAIEVLKVKEDELDV